MSADAAPLSGHFHDSILRGGFPQCALTESMTWAQKRLREDLVDKVLKRDLADFGITDLQGTPILKIPTALACCWLSRGEAGA